MFGRKLAEARKDIEDKTNWINEIQAARRAEAQQARDLLEATRQGIVDDLVTDFYRAYAAFEDGGPSTFKDGQLGVMRHATHAIARITGTDPVTVSFRMDYGIPPGPRGDGWTVVNTAPSYAPPVCVLQRPDGTETDLDQHVADTLAAHRNPNLVAI